MMNLKTWTKNWDQSGSALMQVMVALGLFSVISLGVASLTNHSIRQQRVINFSENTRVLADIVIASVANEDVCTQMIANGDFRFAFPPGLPRRFRTGGGTNQSGHIDGQPLSFNLGMRQADNTVTVARANTNIPNLGLRVASISFRCTNAAGVNRPCNAANGNPVYQNVDAAGSDVFRGEIVIRTEGIGAAIMPLRPEEVPFFLTVNPAGDIVTCSSEVSPEQNCRQLGGRWVIDDVNTPALFSPHCAFMPRDIACGAGQVVTPGANGQFTCAAADQTCPDGEYVVQIMDGRIVCQPAQAMWTVGPWGPCMLPGQRTRAVTCVNAGSGLTLANELPCSNRIAKPQVQQVCSIWTWQPSGWGVCLSQGIQYRQFECRDQNNVLSGNPAVDCPMARPVTTQTCVPPLPPPGYRWQVGAYGACVAGNQTRVVQCQETPSMLIVPDATCVAAVGAKPPVTTPCAGAPLCWTRAGQPNKPCQLVGACAALNATQGTQCETAGVLGPDTVTCLDNASNCTVPTTSTPPTYAWDVGAFGICIGPEGGAGTQSRTVQCKESPSNVYVADGLCSGPKPAPSQGCTVPTGEPPPPTYAWQIGSWGVCVAPGTQSRSVQCIESPSLVVVGDGNCGVKPATSQACPMPPTYSWVLGAYGACSALGQQTRTVECRESPSNNSVALSYCTPPVPLTVATCTPPATYSWQIGGWGACVPPQTRLVQCISSPSLAVVADANCGAKPADTQACVNPVNGVCGGHNNQTLGSAPTLLCSSGNPTAVAGGGPWTWSCMGISGGSNASCQAFVAAAPVNGWCGSAHGTPTASAPSSSLCVQVSASAVTGSGPWSWTCFGANGGVNQPCSAPVSPGAQCGPANGVSRTTAPTTGLCAVGTPTAVAGSGPWTWSCLGSSNASCSAPQGGGTWQDPDAGGFPDFQDTGQCRVWPNCSALIGDPCAPLGAVYGSCKYSCNGCSSGPSVTPICEHALLVCQ